MPAKSLKKLYYSISEVSNLTNLKQYVLRYWETEFPELKPLKNRAGNRIYKEKDIELIKGIMDLLYNKKFTIEGARQKLKDDSKTKKKNARQISMEFEGEERKKILEEIKDEINNIISKL